MAKKRTVQRLIWLAVLVCLGLSCRQVYVWLSTPRQSAVRGTVAANCKGVMSAIDTVRHEGRLPESFDELVRNGLAGQKAVEDFVYVGGRDGILFYQKVPCRAVKKGEPWGEPGGRAQEDIPPLRYFGLVHEDGQLKCECMNEPEFSQKYAMLLAKTAASEPAAPLASNPKP